MTFAATSPITPTTASTGSAIMDTAKTVPTAIYAGLSFFGVTIQDWATLLAIAYTGLQFFLLARKTLRDYRNKK